MRTNRRQAPPDVKKHWWEADEGKVHQQVFQYVSAVERTQFHIFNRFLQLEILYDPHSPNAQFVTDGNDACSIVTENLVASNVDTLTADITAADIRARFMTDGADWSQQRQAKQLEWYAEQVSTLVKRDIVGRLGATSSYKKGTGIAKVYADPFGDIRVEMVRIDDIIVDEAECRDGGSPRQMHRRITNADRDELKAMFPGHDEAIDRAQSGRSWQRRWAGYRPLLEPGVVAIESHRLPIGRRDHKGYRPGRHTITIDGDDLLDEPWHKPFFPYAKCVYKERESGWYGISLPEGIAGIQRASNKLNWQIDRHIDQYAVPTTYVSMADAKLAVQTVNRIGTVVVHKGAKPETVIPTAVSPEVYQRQAYLKAAGYEMTGISRMAAQAVKPVGVDSAVALREHKDQASEHHAPQEKAYEQFILDITLLILDVCKDLGDDAPVVMKKTKFGARKIKWSDVDMGDVRCQISAASTMSRTPAGRTQFVIELAQAGIISQDSVARLLQHPDLERELSLYTSALESIEEDFEEIADGSSVVPEPFDNHEMIVWRGQRQYNQWRKENAPEQVLEELRQYVVIAAWYVSQKNGAADAANGNAAAPGAPGEIPAGVDPNMPQLPADPTAVQPVASLAPQAMQLRTA